MTVGELHDTMRPDMITQIIRKQFFRATDVCNWKSNAHKEWPQNCRKKYWTKMVQNGPNDHFGQMTYSEQDFSIRETKMDHKGQFWPILA